MCVLQGSKLDKAAGYVFLIPWFLGFFLLNLVPLCMSLYYSFTNFSLLSTPTWCGFDNYVRLFTTDFHFKNAVRVTLTYVFTSVPLQLLFALFLAFVLNKGIPGLAGLRAAFYIPSLLGGSVAITLLWRQIFGTDGILNSILGSMGFEELAKTAWITDPDTAVWSLVLLRVWQFGSPMIIFLAGIKQIPSEIVEAAAIDGAGRLRQIWNVEIPILSPIILFNVVMQIISAFKLFTEAYMFGGQTGGVSDSLLFYTVLIYNEGFNKMRMGYASALSWILLLMVSVFTIIAFRMSNKHVHYN